MYNKLLIMKYYITICSLLLMTLLVSCGGHGGASSLSGGDTLTHVARLLTMVDHGDFTAVDIADPWKPGEQVGKYVLVSRGADVALPDGYKRIDVPVRSMAVFSSVHAAAFEELGDAQLITAVADGAYVTAPTLVEGLRSGRIRDVGTAMTPSVEALVDLSPDIVVATPGGGADHTAINKSGIAVVEMADYMEATPLARAEWIKLLGALTGHYSEAAAIYAAVDSSYNAIAQSVNLAHRAKVLTETEYSGMWYVPGGHSYMATLIRDAGGATIAPADTCSGSLALDYAKVYDLGHDADVWLVKTDRDMTLADLAAANKLNATFDCFVHRNVFACNTLTTPFFNDIAFHPERILSDYARIFAGSGLDSLRYFKRLE
jgi:iron complex transport system substrate-binding protein